ncbi:MAG: putative zinc-binding protein [Pirellulaceae bacterium]
MDKTIPILFACSGCSNAGQLANEVACELNRRGIAEMSCLAGVGAAKPLFLKKLVEREVWIIDGCPIQCSLGVFGQVREQVDVHIRLHDLGIKKNADAPQGHAFEALMAAVLEDANKQRKQLKAHESG